MGDDLEGIPSNFEREEDVVAAAQHIVRLLGTHGSADDHLRSILADLDAKLAAMKIEGESKSSELNQTKDRLRIAEEKITNWLSNPAMVWDSEPNAFAGYLKAVDEVRGLVRVTTSLSQKGNNESEKIRHQAENILHSAMERLEDVLKDILSHCLLTGGANISPLCCEVDGGDKGSIISAEDESFLGSSRRASCSTESEYAADFVRPDLVPILKSVANVMFASNYHHEFCEVFIASQKEVLDGCLVDLGIEQFSIEEVMRMDWNQLDGKIKTWIRAIKIFFQVYVTAEKRLCDQIFEEEDKEMTRPISSSVFADIATPSMFTLLTFGQGVAIAPRGPEKLFSLLNMYEALSDLHKDMVAMFLEEQRPSIGMEWQELATRLGCSAKATFLEFGDIILSNPSTGPFPSGRVHHITKYVMNYIRTLEVYTNTLNVLLQDNGLELGINLLVHEEGLWNNHDNLTSSPLAHHLHLTVDKLELNLGKKSQLYKDVSLGHFFLLNNTYYIVQKVRGSELQPFLGDDWIKKRKAAYYQHATRYERSSWSSVLGLLKDEGGSSNTKRTVLRDQLRSFTSAFEELYKTQTGWLVEDEQLKSELRIMITQKLILAYQCFTKRCKDFNLEKYIKYESDDLINLISDLFNGSPRSLNNRK